MKKIISCATSDLVTDQRIHRICKSLVQQGFDVTAIGRKKSNSPELGSYLFKCKRIRSVFQKGPLFYLEHNIRLFFQLLFQPFDVLIANDLDTLLACSLASAVKGKELIYDSHEYFTEVPELIHRPLVRKLWSLLEASLITRPVRHLTVSESIARAYGEKYRIEFEVVRNFPEKYDLDRKRSASLPSIKKGDHQLIIYQGSVNVDRGLEEMIMAMEHLPQCFLYIIGEGDVLDNLRKKAGEVEWGNRIIFTGRVEMTDLPGYTVQADLGLSIEKASGLSYTYAMPNKVFDYVQAGIPSLISELPEMKKVNEQFNFAQLLSSHEPLEMAMTIKNLLEDGQRLEVLRANAREAREVLCWDIESEKIRKLFADFLGRS